MWQMIYPVIMIVAANTLYNICAKSTPKGINPFASLMITYTVAALLCMIMFFVTAQNKSLSVQFSKINWAAPILGTVIVGLGLGFLLVYRNGWQMNRISVTANIILAVILIFVAMIMYGESITLKQIAGVAVCAAGLILIS